MWNQDKVEVETIISFEVKQVPKPRDKSGVVQVNGDDRAKKGSTAPHLDDEAGVGDVGNRTSPITLKSRSRTPPKGRGRADSALARGFGFAMLKAATEATKTASSAIRNLGRKKKSLEERLDLPALREPDPEPRIEPMSLVLPRVERDRSPSPEVPESRGVRTIERERAFRRRSSRLW